MARLRVEYRAVAVDARGGRAHPRMPTIWPNMHSADAGFQDCAYGRRMWTQRILQPAAVVLNPSANTAVMQRHTR